MNSDKVKLVKQAVVLLQKALKEEVITSPKPPAIPVGPKFYVIKVDGFTGNEGNTKYIPSKDVKGFNRWHVEKGYHPGRPDAYGYTSKDFNDGIGWVNYRPYLTGKFRAKWYYQQTKNRSSQPAYIIFKGKTIKQVYQKSTKSQHISIDLGVFDLQKKDFIAVHSKHRGSISFGRMEFTRIGGSVPSIPSIPSKYTKRKIAEVKGQSFMSMEQISKDELIAGCYSAAATSKVFVITILGNGKFKAQMVDQPKTGEAAFRSRRIDNTIWFAMEDRLISKCVYKANPMEYKFKVFRKLKDGLNDGAFDVRKLLGKTVFLGCEIYTLGHGTRKEFGNDYYCKFLFEANNKAFAGGYNAKENRAGWFESTNALTWKWESIGVKYNRFMQTLVSHDQKTLWLVGTKNYKGGHNSDSARLWRYDFKTKKLRTLYTFKGFDYSSCIKRTTSGKIVIGLTKRWKGKEVGAKLIHWDGKPHDIATFDEAEIREIVCIGSKTYCATRTNRVRGRVYEVSGL